MDKISTKKLLLYLFNETEMTDSVLIQHSIDTDYATAEAFKEMTETLNYMDFVMMVPEKSTINNILAYSKSIRSNTFG